MIKSLLHSLSLKLKGELYSEALYRVIYATDASVYRNKPLAIAYPKVDEDIRELIKFSQAHGVSLIPRTAGTSLAGQCVGEGIIVDVSKHFTEILEFDKKEKTILLQPGVIRDELNLFLKPHGLFFSPNTSTSSFCMIGGMVGNNSSGTTSIAYGVTRDKVLEIEAYLSDASKVIFSPKNKKELEQKTSQNNLEGKIYKTLTELLSNKKNQNEIKANFPKKNIHRRNNGYAIDELIKSQPFSKSSSSKFNICKLLSGSEGTLVFMTKIKLKLDDLPPPKAAMITPHFDSVLSACSIVKHVMKHQLYACEMMDDIILNCTKENRLQRENRKFIKGNPKIILMLEVRDYTSKGLREKIDRLLETINKEKTSYTCPILLGSEVDKANNLRKAGLGVLGNIAGDAKGVACIEDTAVDINDLESYIKEFSILMENYNQQVVYYAHAGAGELHLRPILNLKKKEDVKRFRKITDDVASLVKKYGGSMSGEHGDGIVRSEFISKMIGEHNYGLLKTIKNTFDSKHIFNPGKIINPHPMDTNLRYIPDRVEPQIKTFMDFSDSYGILGAVEKCNGSGDCRKSALTGELMCPSYQATRDEKDTTRARANALREILTNATKSNAFNHSELKDVLDLCVSCKGCLSECPSSVNMASLKAEFLYQYYKSNSRPLRDIVFAYSHIINRFNSWLPISKNPYISKGLKKILQIHPHRHLPNPVRFNSKKYALKNNLKQGEQVVLLIDEFSKYLDADLSKDAIDLLIGLGYQVDIVHYNSGRAFISKGYLRQAKRCVNQTIQSLKSYKNTNTPLIGLEPSAVLGFRDDARRLSKHPDFESISSNIVLIEEFIWSESQKNKINSEHFTTNKKQIKIHVHCHQKVLSKQHYTLDILNIPKNYTASLLHTGCCGMAGSFGYEKEHYDLSMQIGEQKLFPLVRSMTSEEIIVANGTSCRQQIQDGTSNKAVHPVRVLKNALK